MREETARDSVLSPAGDDGVRPYAVPALDVRGRAVQLGPALDAILERHGYPDAVSRLLAEATVLTALLGSSLKFEGKFILQTETDGPVSMLVVDYRTNGALRAYARFDEERVAAAGDSEPDSLIGAGVLAMTVDQGSAAGRYQGVVPLQGQTLEAAAHGYFEQSEQIPTRVRLAAAQMQVRGPQGLTTSWRAGGIVVQYLPSSSEPQPPRDLPGGDVPEDLQADLALEPDVWTEAQALADTVEDIELTDPDVPVERLLFRLFNERGVRVFESIPLHDECSCSKDRVRGVLASFDAEEIAQSTENGVITVHCEFCGRGYTFDPEEFGEDS